MAFVKRYLNKKERENVVVIGGFNGTIESIIKEWPLLKRTPLALKYLRAAKTFAQKTLEELNKEISSEEYTKVISLAETAQFMMRYDKWKPSDDNAKYFLESEDEMMDIVGAIADRYCLQCRGLTPECPYFKIQQRWEVEPYRTVVDDQCPYAYLDKGEC